MWWDSGHNNVQSCCGGGFGDTPCVDDGVKPRVIHESCSLAGPVPGAAVQDVICVGVKVWKGLGEVSAGEVEEFCAVEVAFVPFLFGAHVQDDGGVCDLDAGCGGV